MSKSKTNWNREELQTYLFIYCMNADYTETKEELAIFKEHYNSDLYEKLHKEFDLDNDYQTIQKIKTAIDTLGYTKEDINKLFEEIKSLFLSDGKYDVLEQNVMIGLKRMLE